MASLAGVGSKRRRPREAAAAADTRDGDCEPRRIALDSLEGSVCLTLRVPGTDTYKDLILKHHGTCSLLVCSHVEIAPGAVVQMLSRVGDVASTSASQLLLEEDAADGSQLYGVLVRFASARSPVLAMALSSQFPVADGDGHVLGLKGMLTAVGSHRQDPRELQLAVDSFMTEFERAEGQVSDARTQVSKAMDADGFTVVKRAVVQREAAFESDNVKRKKKRGSIVAPDFYRWQQQESKIDWLAELRAKFEEDKAKIRRLKESRLFKPY